MEGERRAGIVEKLELDFYYGKEAEQFTFYRLPKALITDERFKELSNNAKLLYGLMLDRMSLSRKRGWLDKENKVYIKYSLNNIEEDLNVSRKTAGGLLKELQNIGLIEMIQRSGIANVIYVKNFVSEGENMHRCNNSTSEETAPVQNVNQCEDCTSERMEPVQNVRLCNFGTETSEGFAPVPVENLHTNKKEANNNRSDNNPILPSNQQDDAMDGTDRTDAYMDLIRENIDYDVMMLNTNRDVAKLYDELYQIICDVVCVPRKTIRIEGEEYPYSLVKNKFLKLNASHLEYVISCMQSTTTKIGNIKAYLITALYNAPNTINHYYNAEVNHDLYGV
jgi:hypothetical protein